MLAFILFLEKKMFKEPYITRLHSKVQWNILLRAERRGASFLTELTRSSFCMCISELLTTHKIPKYYKFFFRLRLVYYNFFRDSHKIPESCSRDFGWKSIFLFLFSESITKVDPTRSGPARP